METPAFIYYSKSCEMSSSIFALHCAQRYCKSNQMPNKPVEIEKLPSGKLVLKESGLHVSVSHSRGSIACAVHHDEIGLDLELQRPLDFIRISRRFYTPSEADFVESTGGISFFILWTMKESYAKLTGQPLPKTLSSLNTVTEKGLTFSTGGYCFEPFCVDNKFMLCTCKKQKGFKLITL